jgi:LAO/AO transport system kinase
MTSASSGVPGALYASLAQQCKAGNVRAIARLITGLENEEQAAYAALNSFVGNGAVAQVIGVTGPPGAGKSTLADKLEAEFRASGRRVGVLAVDPSSPFSGGAILGDRLRMQRHATDPDVYIRSLASRGALGGVSRATGAAVQVLEAAGYDTVIIETVGVGQSEIDIVKIADCVILVSVPGLGDEIQILKAGIMEIGDIFVVNKADREGADRVVREIRAMLETQYELAKGQKIDAGPDTLSGHLVGSEAAHHAHLGAEWGASHGERVAPAAVSIAQGAEGVAPDAERVVAAGGNAELQAIPPVVKTVAETGEGVGELVAAIEAHFARGATTGSIVERRLARARAQISELFAAQVLQRLEKGEGVSMLDEMARRVAAHQIDPYSASTALLREIVSRDMLSGEILSDYNTENTDRAEKENQ